MMLRRPHCRFCITLRYFLLTLLIATNYALYKFLTTKQTSDQLLKQIRKVIQQPIVFSKELLISLKVTTTTTSTTTTTTTTNSPNPFHTSPNIYLLSAYLLLTQRELRLVGIMECWNRVNFFVNITQLNGSIATLPLRKQGIDSWCPTVSCNWTGHYFIVDNVPIDTINTTSQQHIIIISEYSKQFAVVQLKVVDDKKPRKYYLTACMKPIFLNADWTGLLQYLLIGRALGIEKFILYVQQVSPETDEILKIFESEHLVERVSYGFLPTTDNHIDVNSQMFFSDELTVLNDCLLRSRGDSEWVTMVDLDEIMADVSGNGRSLSDLIRHLVVQNATATGFMFRSTKTSFQMHENTKDSVALKQLSFDYLAKIKRNRDVWGSGTMSRMVVKPECINRIYVHYILGWERNCSPTQINVNPDVGLLFHLRRVKSYLHPDERQNITNVLEKFAQNASDYWQIIVNKYQLSTAIWRYDGVAIMQQVEDCVVHLYTSHGNICLSVARRCTDTIRLNRTISWNLEKSNWLKI